MWQQPPRCVCVSGRSHGRRCCRWNGGHPAPSMGPKEACFNTHKTGVEVAALEAAGIITRLPGRTHQQGMYPEPFPIMRINIDFEANDAP